MNKEINPIYYTDKIEWCTHNGLGWTYIFVSNDGCTKIAQTKLSLGKRIKKSPIPENFRFVIAFVGAELCAELQESLKEHRFSHSYGTDNNSKSYYFTPNKVKSIQKIVPDIGFNPILKKFFDLGSNSFCVIEILLAVLGLLGYFPVEMLHEEDVLPFDNSITKEILRNNIKEKAMKRMKAIIQK